MVANIEVSRIFRKVLPSLRRGRSTPEANPQQEMLPEAITNHLARGVAIETSGVGKAKLTILRTDEAIVAITQRIPSTPRAEGVQAVEDIYATWVRKTPAGGELGIAQLNPQGNLHDTRGSVKQTSPAMLDWVLGDWNHGRAPIAGLQDLDRSDASQIVPTIQVSWLTNVLVNTKLPDGRLMAQTREWHSGLSFLT